MKPIVPYIQISLQVDCIQELNRNNITETITQDVTVYITIINVQIPNFIRVKVNLINTIYLESALKGNSFDMYIGKKNIFWGDNKKKINKNTKEGSLLKWGHWKLANLE